ncbi:RibD family protein [Pantanalinema rosaneae CENA516]|uniref:RibD family protein n=1 Tax=Pantanalinema rosaneae TaxID=1620701 RepID=UPI003D6E8CD0
MTIITRITPVGDSLVDRPKTIVVLATSLDGKITDFQHTAARFSSAADKAHLEQQIAQVDGVIFGAATLRAYGTTLPITHPALLAARQQAGKPPQPVHIVCSRSAVFDTQLPFFRQAVPRWLLTSAEAATHWQHSEHFQQICVLDPHDSPATDCDWRSFFHYLSTLGWQRLAVLGGGTLVASLLAAQLLDEFWITLCPLLLGGNTTPTLVAGSGFPQAIAPRLQLLSVNPIDHEIFLHYRVSPPT